MKQIISVIVLASATSLFALAQSPNPQGCTIPPSVVFLNPLAIHMSPTGDDSKCGFTTDTSVLTIGRVQEILASAVSARDRDIEVRIAPGIYRNQTVRWKFTIPNHTIKFMPLFNDKNRPIFDGSATEKAIWFYLDHAEGQATNLVFHYIKVQNYSTAIDFHGNRDDDHGFNSFNQIYGCYFLNIGKDSTSAVRLVNSRNNRIVNSHFVNILRGSGCGDLHALYVAHRSSGNQILRNRFKNGCGDPIRIRDYSNDNVINENHLIKIGRKAAYTDWYCDHDVRTDCTKPAAECPSWNNQFRNNVLERRFWQWLHLRDFYYFQDAKATGCSPPSPDARRLRTSGNVSK
ncbi:MAG: hypothetical protein ACKVQW_03245 [Pyrinomonadaceae bacterium]